MNGEPTMQDSMEKKQIDRESIPGMTIITTTSHQMTQEKEAIEISVPEKEKSIIGEKVATIAKQVQVTKPVSLAHFLDKGGVYEPYNDYTDIGQSKIFIREFGHLIRHSPATGFIIFDGHVWLENDILTQGLSQEITERQKQEAEIYYDLCIEKYAASAKDNNGKASEKTKLDLDRAVEYIKYVSNRRNSKRVQATLEEAKPRLNIDPIILDHNPFLLNTPDGTVDLRFGMMRPHNVNDFCTKTTAVSPSDDGTDLFNEFLLRLTCGDQELENYLQEIAGMFLVGKVFSECLIIAYGSGGNGKSSFFNLLSMVMGDYAGTLSSDLLIQKKNHNKAPEKADLRGKRLVIASELEEGQQLDTGLVKQICSTDPIKCEPKYRMPYSFIPSHSTVLYTNFLPRISSNDSGTWDRIKAVPFRARFRNTDTEIKNYADYMFHKCGGAVLKWMIAGAARYIENGYKITEPQCVKDAIDEYRQDSDWISQFINGYCVEDPSIKTGINALYQRYKTDCFLSKEAPRTEKTFKEALEGKGYVMKKTNIGMTVFGLGIA